MAEQTCHNCRYYLQHYALDKRKIPFVYCGHCTLEKAKPKRPDSKICERFVQGEPDKAAFVTKEYLSKELLQYLLHLELLPEITNIEKKE